jgi:hypothetical protein
MTDLSATTAAPNTAATKAKVRQKAIIRFPYSVHGGITPALNRAFERATAGNSLLAVADIVRMSAHNYFLQTDPMYRQEIGGPNA